MGRAWTLRLLVASLLAALTPGLPVLAPSPAAAAASGAAVPLVFNYTGAAQQYLVPAGITSIAIDAQGAQGTDFGGLGGRTQATISVTPGETLYVHVGGRSGFNGGGLNSKSGGGASDVRQGANALNNRRIVAGGRGAGGYLWSAASGGSATYGGAGGGTTAAAGQGSPGGKGGTQTSGGAGGETPCPSGVYGAGGPTTSVSNCSGGGGGGGLFGGGQGYSAMDCYPGGCIGWYTWGGGGGSSFASAAATGVTHTQGYRAGDGVVYLYGVPTAPPPSAPADQTRGTGTNTDPTVNRRSDPVNTATGAFTQSHEDMSVPAPGVGISFGRSYNSDDNTIGVLGRGWTHSYASSLSVQPNGDVVLRDEEGAVASYVRSPDGAFARPAGMSSSLYAVAAGYELVRRDQLRYRFNPTGRLTGVVDDAGVGVSVGYDGSGRPTTVTDAAGRAATLSYDGAGHLVGVASPDGRSVNFTYAAGLLASAADPAGATTTYSYDPGGRLASIVDPNGHAEVTNTYDASGRVATQADATGAVSTFAWDAASGTSTLTDASGAVFSDVYAGNVLLYSDEPAGRSRYSYTSALSRAAASVTGPTTAAAPGWWNATYDGAGRMLTRSSPANLFSESWAYDASGHVTRATDPLGRATTYAYDASGRLVTTTHPDNSTETRTYTATGGLASLRDPRGNTSNYNYDSVGNLTRATTATGASTTWAYDAAGRVISTDSPRGNVAGADAAQFRTSYTYDAAGRVTSKTTPGPATTAYT